MDKKQVTSTGRSATKTPILARDGVDTVDASKRAPTKDESASFLRELALFLSLVQEDLYQCQRRLKQMSGSRRPVSLAAKEGNLMILVRKPQDHDLGFADGHITLDGVPVLEWEA